MIKILSGLPINNILRMPETDNLSTKGSCFSGQVDPYYSPQCSEAQVNELNSPSVIVENNCVYNKMSVAENDDKLNASQKEFMSRVKDACEYLSQNFEKIGLPEEFRQYLSADNIVYEYTGSGAAHALRCNKISIELGSIDENAPLPTTSDIIKLLIHEANHCYRNDNVPESQVNIRSASSSTIEEERECETLAMRTIANLVKLEDYPFDKMSLYSGRSYGELNDDLINGYVDRWLSGAYRNRLTNFEGDIKIQHNVPTILTAFNQGKQIPVETIFEDYSLDEIKQVINSDENLRGLFGNISDDKLQETIIKAQESHSREIEYLVSTLAKNDKLSIDIAHGSAITIGNQTYVIGENGIFLRSVNGTSVCELIDCSSGQPKVILSNIRFEKLPPSAAEQVIVGKQASDQSYEIASPNGKIYKFTALQTNNIENSNMPINNAVQNQNFPDSAGNITIMNSKGDSLVLKKDDEVYVNGHKFPQAIGSDMKIEGIGGGPLCQFVDFSNESPVAKIVNISFDEVSISENDDTSHKYNTENKVKVPIEIRRKGVVVASGYGFIEK